MTIDRRTVLKAGAAAGALAATPGWAKPADPHTELNALFDRMFDEGLQLGPEGATRLGLDKGANAGLRAKLSDPGEAGRAAARALTTRQLADLGRIDRAALSPADQLNYDVVLYTRRSAKAVQAFDFGGSAYGPTPYVISQQSGAYQSTPDFLDTNHPVESASDADAYLSRLSAFAGQLDANTDRLRHDVALGVVPPDYILDKTIAQMVALDVPADQTRLVGSIARRAAAKGLDPRYASDAEAIYAEKVRPALQRQLAAVKALRPKATHDAGIWKIKDGEAFYKVALANTTTSRMSPAEVHQFGIDQAKMLTDRIAMEMQKAGITGGSVGARLAGMAKLDGQIFPNTDEGKAAAIAYCNARLAAIRERLPQAFSRVPPYRFEVRRVPKETEAGAASAFAQGPSLDGKRPGLVYFNLQDSAEWPKFSLDTVIYHEGLPGHQMEGGLALSNADLPLIRKAGGFSGYGEGWALYAEQVADELGMYDNDRLARIGYLQGALFRAHRCMIDTGMHQFRWSRERAIALFVEGQGMAPGFAEREIDRYTVNPGQACSYRLGYATFNGLREKAKRALGAKFDLKAFHDAVLSPGRVPLEILEQVGERWIAGAIA